jgi:glycosyltransferase involved in cell wall biosynthesis
MIENSPLISVVIASYNHAPYIKEAINSIFYQTFQNFEIIITDDGSSDNSIEIIQEIEDERIKLFVFEKNQGACAAINNCILNAKGKYIAVMNSDDVWLKDKLEIQFSYLTNNQNIDAVFSSAEFLDENMKPFKKSEIPFYSDIFKKSNRSSGKWLEQFFFAGNCLCHPSILIKKECYDVIGLYDNRYRQLPDLDMWIKFCKRFKLHVMQDNLVKFRVLNGNKNASSPSLSNQIRGRHEANLIMKSFFDNMSINIFKEGFSAHLINNNFTTNEEYECEKAFLYLKMSVYEILGIELLYNLLGNKITKNILKEKYNFDEAKFIQTTSLHNSFNHQSLDAENIYKIIINKIKHTSKTKIILFIYNKLKLYVRNRLNLSNN